MLAVLRKGEYFCKGKEVKSGCVTIAPIQKYNPPHYPLNLSGKSR